VAELLSKRPQDRPRSASAVLDRLRHLELGTLDARSETSVSTTAVLGQATLTLPVLDPAEITTRVAAYRRPLGGARWVLGGIAALAVGALVLVAFAPTAADLPANDSAQPRSVGPTSTAPSPEPTSTTPSPEPTRDTSEMPRTRETFTTVNPGQAVSDLRAAVGASSGQIETEENAEELSELVDELDEHLAEDGVEDSDEHVKEISEYLHELSEEGELTQGGMLRIADALQTVRDAIAKG
jgi:hypothetical protein